MAYRVLVSLIAGLVVTLSAGYASAAFFRATNVGGHVYQIALNGEAGDPSGLLSDVDLQDAVIFGTTVSSIDLSVSGFFNTALGPIGVIVNPTTVKLGGSDLTDITGVTVPFGPSETVILGNLQLAGAPTDIRLGGTGIYRAGFPDLSAVPISQSFGDSILPEPGAGALLGLCALYALARRCRTSRT